MVKIVGKIDLSAVKEPPKPKRFYIRSKNRKKSIDTQILTKFGRLTYPEAADICKELNSKWDGYFYCPVAENKNINDLIY